MCGVWLDIQTVYSSVPGLYQPMSPRVSIGFGIRRWLTIRWRTTTSAPSTAASVPALSPTLHSNTTLFGAFSWSCGAPGAMAFSASTTAGQRLPVHLDRVERVVRLRLGLGDDRRDALAGPLDAVRGEDPRRVDVVLDARAATGRPGHRQRVVRDVGADEDRQRRRASPWPRDVSIERMLAWAYGLRRMAMWAIEAA